jgi:hypothetical protein
MRVGAGLTKGTKGRGDDRSGVSRGWQVDRHPRTPPSPGRVLRVFRKRVGGALRGSENQGLRLGSLLDGASCGRSNTRPPPAAR